MKTVNALAVVALLSAATAQAGDLLTRDQYIDYQAQAKCAEVQYSYSDPDRYDKEMARIDKAFKVTDKDIENGRMDDLMAKYGSESDVLDAIDAKVATLCPQPL